MSKAILQYCRRYLERSYRERLGYPLNTELDRAVPNRNPTWRFVASTDLTSDGGALADAMGLLLDPEIGILLYLAPFQENTRMSVQVKHALRIRSQLSVERNYSASPLGDSDRDPNGAWRVSICWLVPLEKEKKRWLDQVVELRKGTMFSEEVSLDAIFVPSGKEEQAIEEHGFPGLLLTSRYILRKENMGEVTQWMRADDAVRAALRDFAVGFESSAQAALASELVKELERTSNSVPSPSPDVPTSSAGKLDSLRILNFRNLTDVDLDFGSDSVSTSVIHGPNGTGKSSICEALSIALFGSSYRYNRFADRDHEKDLTTTNRSSEYVTEYLTGIDTKDIEPRLSLNGEAPERIRLIAHDKLLDSELAMSGTILTQDTSLEFARMQADQLGARVLRNYSEVAERVETYTEQKYQSANSARQDFLRGLGLPAAITLLNTAYGRIAGRELNRLVPASLDAHIVWVTQLEAFQWRSAPRGLAAQWREWCNDARRSGLAEAMASNRNERAIGSELRRWLESHNQLVERSIDLARSIRLNVDEHSAVLSAAKAKLRILVEWRSKRVQTSSVSVPAEAEEVKKKLDELQKRQVKVVEDGQNTRAHLEHLSQVEAFVSGTWAKLHPDDCPTCGTNHFEHGGVLNVIHGLKENASTARDRLRHEYTTVNEEIAAMQKRLAVFGQAQCPLTDDELSGLTAAVQWLLPEGVTLDGCLADERYSGNLFSLLSCVSAIPALPQLVQVDELSERISQAILAEFKEAETIFETPDNWKPVRAKITETLARVLREHLPGTLAGLWVELAMNLTSAAWLLPDRPGIEVVTRRGEKRSTLRLRGRLARYILNQSEIHVLGLAWFFARYLTHGRFRHSCLVMDDPAQEMDQTTFRELCRVLETFCRLHRVYGLPLKLVVLLNQENRALELARATGGMAYLLGWVPEQKNTVSVLNVAAPGFFSPLPNRLFSARTSG